VLAIDPGTACDIDIPEDLDTCEDDSYVCVNKNATECVNGGNDDDGDNYSLGGILCGGDCNDNNPNQKPGEVDVCDAIDNDCDGVGDQGCPCEEYTWTGGASTTNWDDPLNWSPNGVPGASVNHCVTIPAGNTVLLPSVPAEPLRDLTVAGTLSHNTGFGGGVQLVITGELTIESTGTVNVNGRGYAQAAGPGAGPNGNSGCSCTNGLSGAGGGHGGNGGAGQGGTPGGGAANGSMSMPTLLGSGGGRRACGSGTAGRGGGRVDLTIGTRLTLDGSIQANGGNGGNSGTGGGSGGSIRISAPIIESTGGSPLIRANGGNGSGDSCSGIGGGGGGGGRIAIDGYVELPGALALQASGGTRGGNARNAGAGTIYLHAAASLPELVVDNRGVTSGATTPLPAGSDVTFTTVHATGNAVVDVSSNDGIEVDDDLTIDSGSSYTTARALTTTNITVDGTLTVAEPVVADTVDVAGTLRHFTGDGTGVDVEANDMVVTGLIDGNGRGYAQAAGPGKGANGNSGCSCTNGLSGAGGGYGGNGGAGQGGTPGGGGIYGDLHGAPVDLGSGGGRRACGSGTAGRGGGRVRLNIANSLSVDGTIRVNGGNGGNSGTGGGSGGSIWITAPSLLTTGSPSITANGGNGSGDSCSGIGGGGGGGGRISILADTNQIPAGNVTATAGALGGNARNGNPGIIMTYPGQDSLVTLTAPADDGAGDASGTVLTWTGVGPLVTRHYHLEIDDDAHFEANGIHPEGGAVPIAAVNESAGTPGGPLTVETYTTPALQPDTKYYWRVVLHNSGHGVEGGSETFTFTTPPAP
jgi:hypothetical protein